MITHKVEQLSEEWFALHNGIPTASNADKILTPTGLLSKQSEGLINRFLAERAGYGDAPFDPTDDMLRGIQMEEEALDFFEYDTGLKVEKVGFITNDESTAGCSPDGLITHPKTGEVYGWESKSPKASTHFSYLRAGDVLPSKYKPQVHFSMALTGLNKWFFQSYYPGLDPLIVLVGRDEYTSKVKVALDEFLERLAEESARFGLKVAV